MATERPGLPAEFPAGWLNQIREAVRQDNRRAFWITLLSSTVVAALLTVIANFGLETYKASLNSDIEQKKADQQLRNEQLKEKRVVYTRLAQDFRDFQVELKTCQVSCKLALNSRGNGALRAIAQQQCGAVSDKMSDIFDSKLDPLIDGEISDEIDQIFDPLGNQLSEELDDSSKIERLSNLIDGLEQSVKKLRKDIISAARAKSL
jgi:hypothetical protein